MTGFKSIDDYLGLQPERVRDLLEEVRRIIGKAVPGAEEVISYQIPAFKLDGIAVLYFAGWKKHYSIYPVTDQILAAVSDTPLTYKTSKGTIQFPLDEPVPAKLIESIAKFRAGEAAEEAKAKKAAKKR